MSDCDHLMCDEELDINKVVAPPLGMSFCSKKCMKEMYALLQPHGSDRETMKEENPERLRELILKAKEEVQQG